MSFKNEWKKLLGIIAVLFCMNKNSVVVGVTGRSKLSGLAMAGPGSGFCGVA